MALIIKEESNNNNSLDFLPSEENHVAVCVGVWDVGKQKSDFTGEVLIKHKVVIRWEIDEEITEGEYKGKKKCVNKFYNLSLHEKSTLRKEIEGWVGKIPKEQLDNGFDLDSLRGKACMLNIVHSESKGKTYANVKGVTKIPKGITVFEPDNLQAYLENEPEFVEKIRVRFAETLETTNDEF